LLKTYGPQGWWPLLDHKGTNPTKTGSLRGYHPGDYTYPKTRKQIFEIMVGAVLTQNTSWLQVEKVLHNLHKLTGMDAKKLLNLSDSKLKQAIRSAGYYNQKALYLKAIAQFFLLQHRVPTREELLAIKGIGRETADSILLYAYQQPHFVVDAYTRRIFGHLGIIPEKERYDSIKKLFEKELPKDTSLLQEYHALIVEHAKRYYTKKPFGAGDPLNKI